MGIFSVLTSKLFGGLSIVLLLATAFLWLGYQHRGNVIEKLNQQIVIVVDAVKIASDNEDATWKTAAAQITVLGHSNRALKDRIDEVNLAINDIADEAERLRQRAIEMEHIANAARAQRAAALRRLSDLAITPGTREDCMTLLAEAEEALDLTREASR